MSAESNGTSGRSSGMLGVHLAAAKAVLHAVERRADHLLDRLRLLLHLERARLEARHVEQVAHEAVQAQRLLVRGLAAARAASRSSRGPCSSSSELVAPVTTASGVRRSCETELRSELRSCSVSARSRARRASSASCVRSSAEPMRPANVSSSCRSSGSARRVSGDGIEREHADAPARALQRDEERARRGQRVGARRPAGRWCSHAHSATPESLSPASQRVRHRRDAARACRRRPARAPRRARRRPRAGDASAISRSGSRDCASAELAADGVEARGAPLAAARACRPGRGCACVRWLMTSATRNMTAKVSGVPQVGDREAEVRRDEEEVERDDAEHGGEERRRVAEAHRRRRPRRAGTP